LETEAESADGDGVAVTTGVEGGGGVLFKEHRAIVGLQGQGDGCGKGEDSEARRGSVHD
jgi:hypothetical protein